RSAFTGANSNRFFDLGHEDFSIADLSGFGRSQDCFDSSLCAIIRDHHFKFYFRKEIDGVLRAAINFAVTFLSAKSFYFAKRHSFYACGHQRFLYRFRLKRLDNRLNLFHRAKTRTAVPKGKIAVGPLESSSITSADEVRHLYFRDHRPYNVRDGAGEQHATRGENHSAAQSLSCRIAELRRRDRDAAANLFGQ